ncbi:hypothetical protein PVAP13_9NG218200 [Panicum virgatum]|uniref:Uncharacterized protein n=2 Tax=Panicum virgatum TaxID=38727 RepID=A0A8T0MN83_PANVG|nr:hypothetical protein PVAP13_9NG218200 [Panicum virgatum]
MYVPIREHGVYVEEDDAIYFLSGAVVYFYKLFKDTQNRYRMAPPTEVSLVCPFSSEGYGFLSYLGGRVMCSVWIGVRLPCHCGTKHVLITTFRVKGDKGVEVLHSTCRRLDMVPSKPVESYLEFSFLQEYEEFDHERVTPIAKLRVNAMVSSTPPDDMEIPASSNVGKSSSMLACCREFLNGTPLSGTVMLQRSAIRSNRTLYIICQAASRSTVYEINILDGRLACHDKTLTPHCILETPMPHFEDAIEGDILYLLDRPWHFLCDSRSIYAVPSVEDKIYSCRFNQGISSRFNRGIINHIDSTWPIGVAFRLVVRLGIKLVAISDTLRDVYHFFEGIWMHHETFGPPGLDMEVSLSGYVVLSPTTFMVSDAKTNRCFLYDLFFDSWSLVMPFVESELLPSDCPRMAFLSDRCVFAKGFIYTCSHGGLAAYELVQQADSYYLGERVDLKLSWCKYWERYQMCLEYIGEDTNSGAIMFCVMKGDYISQPGYPYNEGPIRITTVQVKTEEMPNGKLKPKTIGHVDIGTAFVESSGGSTWTRDCFAAACY